jgi:hypothetical protein
LANPNVRTQLKKVFAVTLKPSIGNEGSVSTFHATSRKSRQWHWFSLRLAHNLAQFCAPPVKKHTQPDYVICFSSSFQNAPIPAAAGVEPVYFPGGFLEELFNQTFR